MRIEELEKENQAQKKAHVKKIKELENACKQKVKGSENQIPEENYIKCNNCDYKTTSRQGLQIHNTKVHSKVSFGEFPAACDVCEKVLENESSLN